MNAEVQGKIGGVGLPTTSQTTLRRWLKDGEHLYSKWGEKAVQTYS